MTFLTDAGSGVRRGERLWPYEKPFQRLRFRLAHWLDRDPRRCWVSLCVWALYGETSLREASQRDDPRCAGPCYCGKNPDPTHPDPADADPDYGFPF